MVWKPVAAQAMTDGEEWVKNPLIPYLAHVSGSLHPTELGAIGGKSYGGQVYLTLPDSSGTISCQPIDLGPGGSDGRLEGWGRVG